MPAEAVQRRPNLALSFQEIFTAIVRIRFNRQAVASADGFREQMRQALRSSVQDGAQKGYSQEDVKTAAFAAVTFLDESVLASNNPVFSTWARLPLQEELFGHNVGGESFFQYAQQLLARRDSAETADILEVFYLCLLLGYRGRYGIGGPGELHAIMDSMRDKIHRVRGTGSPISPQWAVPNEAPPRQSADPWVRSLMIGVAAMAILVIAAYAVFRMGLVSGASALHSLTG
jgi:type VI secretion system protein ImpK